MPLYAKKTNRAPALFIGHGNPMNAIETNAFTNTLKHLGEGIQTPKAILVISAHWVSRDSTISLHEEELMYDMFGFPDALYEVEYPAPNAKFLVPTIEGLVSDVRVQEKSLDHGVWSVLTHLFPKADVPVMQLAINDSLSTQEHFEVGRKIRSLRENGVMIMGSGNITHNLGDTKAQVDAPISSWAKEFDDFTKEAIEKRDFTSLINFKSKQKHALKAHPTTEHYLPLLYVAGASYDDDVSSFIYNKIEHGSISMRSWMLN